MIRAPLSSSLPAVAFAAAALLVLGGCDGSRQSTGGNATMRDMEVVDGTANDSMADLDNATVDGTLLANGAGGLPGAVPMDGIGGSGNAAASDSSGNSSAPAAAPDRPANSSAPE